MIVIKSFVIITTSNGSFMDQQVMCWFVFVTLFNGIGMDHLISPSIEHVDL